jgi:ABC-type enterochelin transport system substrate-binding protein
MSAVVLTMTDINEELARLQAEIARMKTENENLKKGTKPVSFKVSEKGAVSVYGLNARFPVTLYKDQWHRLFEKTEDLKKFIEENNDKLASK